MKTAALSLALLLSASQAIVLWLSLVQVKPFKLVTSNVYEIAAYCGVPLGICCAAAVAALANRRPRTAPSGPFASALLVPAGVLCVFVLAGGFRPDLPGTPPDFSVAAARPAFLHLMSQVALFGLLAGAALSSLLYLARIAAGRPSAS